MIVTIIISTFITVLLAELGDKTQLATIALSGSTEKPFAVFLGSSSALVLASLIGALAGGSIAKLIPSEYMKLLASIGLIIIGIKLLWPIKNEIINIVNIKFVKDKNN